MNKSLKARSGGARADLHSHTCASDSRWTPHDVVVGCLDEGIDLLAIADHDTSDSVVTAEALALDAGLSFLRAIEVSSTAEDILVHILAYGVDIEDSALQTLLADNRAHDEAKRQADVQRLNSLGYPVSLEGYIAHPDDRTRGGFKLLNYIIDQGIVANIHDYAQTISPQLEKPWGDFAHPADAIEVIRGAGGIPVMAHPGGSLRAQGGVTDMNMTRMLNYGLAGFECFSRYHDINTMGACLQFCYKRDLIITGGSDFHGHLLGRKLGSPQVRTDQLRLHEIVDRIRHPAYMPELTPAD